MNNKLLICSLASLAMVACAGGADDVTTKSGLDKTQFESVIDGKPTHLYVLSNSRGMEVCITNYGGRVVSMLVPDKDGGWRDVVLGFDSIADYQRINGNFGAVIGRYGNRIGHGRLEIDSVAYQLPINDRGNCLHGGLKGFHDMVWDAMQLNDSTLSMKYVSADGEEGFPGTLDVEVTYSVTADNALKIDYKAETDQPTVVNLTNHTYFNLSGDASKSTLDEYVYINADAYTPVDSSLIPTGEICSVEGTPFDFRQPKPLGKDINVDDAQLAYGNQGYDHNMVLNSAGDSTVLAASVRDVTSGIVMELYTTEPGMQFYTGNYLGPSVKGKKGVPFTHFGAICMETQHFPDSPNKPDFPSTLLRPGEVYHSVSVYRFTISQ